MFTLIFWKDAGERALKTFSQTLVALLTAGGMNLMTIDFKNALSVAGFAALTSLLTSVASVTISSKNSASLVVDITEPSVTTVS